MSEWQAEISPLLSDSPRVWDDLIEATGPASLLLVIESRLSTALRRYTSAEDILQESLMYAWRDRAKCQWRGLKSFRAWLISIIENRIRDAADHGNSMKRGGGHKITSLTPRGASAADGSFGPVCSTTPSRIAIHREQAEAMKAALEAIPPELREVVRMRLFDQCQINEIARQLEIGEAAVRHRFRKGAELYYRLLRSELTSRSQSLSPESTALLQARSSPDS